MTRALRLELFLITALAAALAAAVPLHAGKWSWSWDALNHHVYLGLIGEHARWDLDIAPASVQSYQYPYLYWPVYRLASLPISGATAGAIWGAFLAAMLVVPTWLVSLRLLRDEGGWQGVFERAMACALALSSVIVLAAINTTANDPLAAVPVLWAVAVMAVPAPSDRRAAAAAALWGMSAAFKLSAGLLLPLLAVWWWAPGPGRWWLRRGVAVAAGAIGGFVVTYAPWAWQLWAWAGNPFHPQFRGVFGG